MIKLEKIAFWLTLTTFAFPLAMRLGNGYRLYLFEIPLWCVYFFWAFRFGLKDQRLQMLRIDLYFFLFMVWLGVSVALNETWELGANTGWFWVKCYLIGFYLRHNLYRYYSLRSVMIFLMMALFCEASLGLVQGITQTSIGAVQQYFGQEMEHISIYKAGVMSLVRVQGTFKHSNILGNWIVLLLPLVVAKALMSTGRARLLYWVCSIIAGVTLVLTLSRGNWGAAVFGIIMMFYATGALTLKRINWPRFLLLGLITGVYLASLVFTYFDELSLFSKALAERVQMLPGSRSESTRYNLILGSAELIAENPWFGVGLGKSNELLHYTEYEIRDRFSSTVHNIFLIIATEGGIIGCLLFFLVLWRPFKHIYRIARVKRETSGEENRVAAAGMVGGYSALLFAMLWYTGMLDQAELPLIMTFINLARALRPDQIIKPAANGTIDLAPQANKFHTNGNGHVTAPPAHALTSFPVLEVSKN